MNLEKDFEEWDREELIETRRALNQLLESAAWRMYSTLVQKQIEARINGIILIPLGSLDGALNQEFQKGEIAALRLALAFPDTLINQFTLALEWQEKQNGRE